MPAMLVDPFAAAPSLDPDLAERIGHIRADLRAEYLESHSFPWIVGFSGGKDSTLVAHLVFDMLLSLSPAERSRQIHIVSNDTLVESPLVIGHIANVQADLRAAAEAWRLPVTVVTTRPDDDATFWVNLIGRGYPSPNRTFRWCTDRMKIQPTSRYIRAQATATGEVILLLGVRRDESSTRASTVARYDNGQRLNRHNDLVNCMVFRPIVELSTEDVWEFLGAVPPPWGGSHESLIGLYRNAQGGECPVVTQKSDAPSCGTSSSRFGCWTCTVVEKDRSLEGFVEAGFAEFGPLIDFRDWLASIRNDPSRRQAPVPIIAFDFKGDMADDQNALHRAFEASVISPPHQPVPLDVLSISDQSQTGVTLAAQRLRDSLATLRGSGFGAIQKDALAEAAERALGVRHPCKLTDIRDALRAVYNQRQRKEDGAITTLNDLCRLPLFAPDLSPAQFFRRSWIIRLSQDLPELVRVSVVTLVTDALDRYLNSLSDAPTDVHGNRALRVLCVIDEAHRILGTKLPGLSGLIRLSRSKGGAVMLISQSPEDFEGEDDEFLNEMGMVAAFGTNASAKAVKRILGAGANLAVLEKGQAWVKLRGEPSARRIAAWR